MPSQILHNIPFTQMNKYCGTGVSVGIDYLWIYTWKRRERDWFIESEVNQIKVWRAPKLLAFDIKSGLITKSKGFITKSKEWLSVKIDPIALLPQTVHFIG